MVEMSRALEMIHFTDENMEAGGKNVIVLWESFYLQAQILFFKP